MTISHPEGRIQRDVVAPDGSRAVAVAIGGLVLSSGVALPASFGVEVRAA